jgi:hypothetical protein
MVRHEGGIFERAAELAEHGDSGGAEGVIADARGDARSRRALAHQLEGIDPVQHIARQFAVASDRAEQRPLGIGGDAGAIDIGVEEGFRVAMAGHVMELATLLMQAHPDAPVLREDILDLHADDRADAGEGIEHEANQRLVAQIDVRRAIDAIGKRPPKARRYYAASLWSSLSRMPSMFQGRSCATRLTG